VFLESEAAILVFLVAIPALASEAWLDQNHLLYNFACRVAWANTGEPRVVANAPGVFVATRRDKQ